MATRDIVKIARARDTKFIRDEKTRIEILQQENRYPTRFDFPLTLQFELTTHCNVRCKHCYNDSGSDNNARDRMTGDGWKKFAHYLVSKGGIFHCVISGGEPLLMGNDLFDIMDILHDDGTSFLVISNAFLLTQEKVHSFAKYRYKWFQISIDGANADWHDDFRQCKGSWEKAVNGAYMLSKEGIPLTIAHSITPGNLYQIDKMCKLAYELGAGSIIVGEVNPSGRSANNIELTLNHDQKSYLYEKISELSNTYNGKMLIQRSSSTKNQLFRYMNTPNSGAVIRPNGDIRLDCMAPFTIGNVLDDDFATVWQNKAGDCWHDPRVIQYAEGYDEDSDINENYKNYFDADIKL